mmetsp:Transcript_24411/g.66283  ORF Transcript_24411/g.66283 Transcript_24411/m.66283 type:complete len:300 (-) Transcript_24411:866-1765(-)
MSSSDSRARAATSPPTVPSNTSCFFCCSIRMRSSTVFFMMKRTARTGLCWPMRCARSMAWSSAAGFHHGSIRKMWVATVRLSATPPALREMRITFTAGSVMKASMAAERALTAIEPSSLTTCTPPRWSRHSMRSSMDTNCEKTMALPTGSRDCMLASSSMSASILVEDLNWLRLMRLRMPLRPRPLMDMPTPAAEPEPVWAGEVKVAPMASPGRDRSMVNAFQHVGHWAGAPSARTDTKSVAHARQKVCLHADWMASMATSWQRPQTSLASTASDRAAGCADPSLLASSCSARAEWMTR